MNDVKLVRTMFLLRSEGRCKSIWTACFVLPLTREWDHSRCGPKDLGPSSNDASHLLAKRLRVSHAVCYASIPRSPEAGPRDDEQCLAALLDPALCFRRVDLLDPAALFVDGQHFPVHLDAVLAKDALDLLCNRVKVFRGKRQDGGPSAGEADTEEARVRLVC